MGDKNGNQEIKKYQMLRDAYDSFRAFQGLSGRMKDHPSLGDATPFFDFEPKSYPESWVNAWIPIAMVLVVVCCCVGSAICFGGGVLCGWIGGRYARKAKDIKRDAVYEEA